VHEIALRRREGVAEGTVAFHFEKPAGFSYEAGQNAFFTLLEPPETDAAGPSRPFTLASAPHEPELMIATRMRDSAFKRALKAGAPGLRLQMDGPAGLMVLEKDASRPVVFLAGGIGITPFLSMVRDAAHRGLRHRIWLFYSNRRPEEAPFLDELAALAARHGTFHLVATMTASPSWSGERRRIGRELLEAHLPDLRAPLYYFAGPPGMAMAMQAMLNEIGIAEQDVRSEEFYGY
jgi:ferredoxin-NADP reductase